MGDAPFILGLDLGQAQDYTAVAIVEITEEPTGSLRQETESLLVGSLHAPELVARAREVPELLTHYTVRHLERFPLGTSYPAIVEKIQMLLHTPQLYDKTELVVDRTGVGAPVCDMLVEAELEPVSITITGGDTVTQEGQYYRVPKRDLVSVVQVLQQTRRLKVVPSLPTAAVLVQEMQTFQVRLNPRTAHDSYGAWREGTHDDVLLATAIACWYGENRPGPWLFW